MDSVWPFSMARKAATGLNTLLCLRTCAGYLGHPFGKQVNFWEKISIVSKRVNGQFSISACLKLLASQMRRGDNVSFSRASFLNG